MQRPLVTALVALSLALPAAVSAATPITRDVAGSASRHCPALITRPCFGKPLPPVR